MRAPTRYPRRSPDEWQQLRHRAAELFAHGHSIRQVSDALHISYEAVRVWHRTWAAQGTEALLKRPPRGRRPKLSGEQLQQMEAELLKGPRHHGYSTELWTLERIAALIRKLFEVSYHPSHVFKLLRAMEWTCQKPERRARERDEQAIGHWVKRRWPRIKRGPSAQAPP